MAEGTRFESRSGQMRTVTLNCEPINILSYALISSFKCSRFNREQYTGTTAHLVWIGTAIRGVWEAVTKNKIACLDNSKYWHMT
jgi:hypothetical protein